MSYRFLIDLKSDFLSDFLFVFPTHFLHDSEESQNIVQIGYNQQQDENMTKYELNLSMEELEKRTHKDYLTTKKMLEVDAPEYTALLEGDKEALVHLVKAGDVLEKINKHIAAKTIVKIINLFFIFIFSS